MIESFFSSMFEFCFSNIFGPCVSWISEKANYFRFLKDNVDALDKAWAELSALEKDVIRRVEAAEETPNIQRKEVVKLWLEKVRDAETEFDELKRVRSEEMDRLCLGGCCSKNFKSSYQFGKKVANLKKTVTTLKVEGGNFKDDVADRAASPPAKPLATERVSESQVQRSTLDEVWGCLRGESAAEIIGLYGPGGVGKTTLLKQINNKFSEESCGFQVIIWVVVSNKPSIEKIQGEIGQRIGFSDESWKTRSIEEKAQDISNALAKKKFALLLDDIWNYIDFTEVGVPLQSLKSAGSKIVFTTRQHDVSDQLNSKKFEVKCLADEEAWELFQETVGRGNLHDSLIVEQARIMYKECDGLPLALVVIGRAMAGKRTRQEWEVAIEDLKKLSSEFSDMKDKVYYRLKYSYDNLSNDRIRSCFLYCSLFPEDYKIPKRDLLDCYVGEGFVDVYNRGYSIIGELVRACLLEEEEGNDYFGHYDCVKMHDVIRDMALWIAKKENENFLVEAGVGLTESPDAEKWKGIKRLSLMFNEIESLPAVPTCPDLITLFLNHNSGLTEISDDFFQNMSSLQVLDLSWNRSMKKLPLGISNLISLQHLDLSISSIIELPEALGVLENLKCLKAEDARSLCKIPKQLISGFKKLQVLRIAGCDFSNEAGEDSILYGGCELLVEELCELKQLNALSVTLKSCQVLEKFLRSDKLKSCTQYLSLADLEESITHINISFLTDMKNLDTLDIISCELLKFMEMDLGEKISIETHGFHTIQTVVMELCCDLRDLRWLILAPNLKNITIDFCYNVEEIITAEKLSEVQKKMIGDLNPFQKLQTLRLRYLRRLRSIYPNALPFPHLKELDIAGCPNLKKLPLDSNSIKNGQIKIYGKEDWWKELQWEDEATKNAFLPSFVSR